MTEPPLLRKVVRRARGHLDARLASAALRKADRGAATIEDAVELSFRFEHRGIAIAPYQIRSEIETLLRELQQRSIRTVLQIGTCTGGTLFLLARAAAPDALLVSIDLYHGQFGGGYSPWRSSLYRSFARRGQRIELILGDSHASTTVDRVRRALAGRLVDFLFIDGDHSYDGVAADYEAYSPLVAPGGLIGFHDIVPGPPSDVGGVPVFWHELRNRVHDARELVENWEQGSAGIGLITLP